MTDHENELRLMAVDLELSTPRRDAAAWAVGEIDRLRAHAPAIVLTMAALRASRADWLRKRLDALPLAYVGATIEERIRNRCAYDEALADLHADLADMQDRPRLTETGSGARVTMLRADLCRPPPQHRPDARSPRCLTKATKSTCATSLRA
jgi:hypothetical protein